MGKIIVSEPSPAPDISGKDFDERVEAMADWFHENFQAADVDDPDFYGEEPFDPASELLEAFGENLYDEEIEAVAKHFDWRTSWLASENRIWEEEEPNEVSDDAGLVDPPASLQHRLDALSSQLDSLDEQLASWRDQPRLFGHNQPPTEFRFSISLEEIGEARGAIEEIRIELKRSNPADEGNLQVVEHADGVLRKIGRKLVGWLKAAAAAAALGTAAEVGIEFFQDAGALYLKIQSVTEILTQWADHLISLD